MNIRQNCHCVYPCSQQQPPSPTTPTMPPSAEDHPVLKGRSSPDSYVVTGIFFLFAVVCINIFRVLFFCWMIPLPLFYTLIFFYYIVSLLYYLLNCLLISLFCVMCKCLSQLYFSFYLHGIVFLYIYFGLCVFTCSVSLYSSP